MPRLEKPKEPDARTCSIDRPNRGSVVLACRNFLLAHRVVGGPPLDANLAKQFVHQVAAPQTRWEEPHLVSVIGGGTRWDHPYAARVQQSLVAYLAMSEKEREMLLAGIKDGVPWYGEPLPQYMSNWNETIRMRDMTANKYRKQVAESLKRFAAKRGYDVET